VEYLVVSKTHKGISRVINQDSIVVKQKIKDRKEVVFAIICDGVGGLSNGEFASQFITSEFEVWFDRLEIDFQNINLMGVKISTYLKELNLRLYKMGAENKKMMGTTFTALFLAEESYICVHIGDTRLYEISEDIIQITTDQVLAEKKNVLLQCVGASKEIEPQIITNDFKGKFLLLCSDGFRHKLSNDELLLLLKSKNLNSKKMKVILDSVFDLLMKRNERDNISAILIKNNKQTRKKTKWLFYK